MDTWYATPSCAVGRCFTSILAEEWRGVLVRSWNSDRPLFFSYVVLTNMLGVGRNKDIRVRITRRMDLWERGIHAGMFGDSETEGADREGRASSGGEQEDEPVDRSYHETVLMVN